MVSWIREFFFGVFREGGGISVVGVGVIWNLW